MDDFRSKIHIISKNFSHHSTHSGYDRILDFLSNTPTPGLTVSSLFSDKYKSELISNCLAHIDGYRIDEVDNEIDIMWYMPLFKKHIFHFLYGENCFCYSTTKITRNKIFIATYHQPEVWFSMHGKARYEYFTSKIKLLDAVFAVSSDQAEFFRQFNKKVFCIHHGIDTDFFTPSANPLPDPNICLFVGNWLRDFDTLKECCRIMKLRNPEVRIQVVTPEKNRPLLEEAELEIFSGIDDIALREKYRNASVALLPLKACTANNSALEAMACGLPTVVSDIGGIRDYLTEDCAVFCEPRNADQMVDSALTLMKDTELRMRMGQNGRERAKTHFSWPIIANQIANIYRQLLSH